MLTSIVSTRWLRWPSKQRLHAGLLSVSVLSMALLTLWLGQQRPSQLSDVIEVREVALTIPAATPPPPPSMQQPLETTPLHLAIQGTGAMMPKIDIKPTIKSIKLVAPSIETPQIQWQSIEVNWDAFDLEQLDKLPSLLTPLRISFPKSLTRKGINHVLVKLDVVIDEQGQLNLIKIIENPYPELTSELQRLVRKSRFTAPQKNDQNVRARFIWPVDIKS